MRKLIAFCILGCMFASGCSKAPAQKAGKDVPHTGEAKSTKGNAPHPDTPGNVSRDNDGT
jgi:hypothetical protein